jgi:MFS family permease
VTRNIFYGWILVAGFWFTYGVLVGFPTFAPPIINAYIVDDLHLNRETLAKIMGSYTLAAGLLAPAASFLTRRYGSRICLLIYCGTMLGACLALALLARTAVHLALCYVLLSASTTGCIVATQTAVARWFARYRAAAMAAVLSGVAVLGTAMTALLPGLAAASWRNGWWLGAGAAIMAGIIIWLMVRDSPEQLGLHADGMNQAPADRPAAQAARVHQTTERWTAAAAIRTPAIWLIIVLTNASLIAQSMFFAHSVVHLRDLGFPVATATLVISAFAFSTLPGKILTGAVGDRIEPRLLAGFSFALLGAGLLLLLHPTHALALVGSGALVGISIGMLSVCEPLLVSNYYGPAVFPVLSGLRAFVTAPLGALLSTLAGRWFDRTGSYQIAFTGTAGICLAAALAFVLFVRPPRWTGMQEESLRNR